MLQQVRAEVQPRLAAQFNSTVRLDITCMVNITFSHHFLCSWYMTKHVPHTCGRSSRPARYLSSSTHSQISKRCLATASSVFLNHCRTLRTEQRRGSKASGFRKQCHEGSTTSSHVVTPLVYSCCSTCSSKLHLYISWNAYFAFFVNLSYSLIIDWRRNRSTRRSIHMNEPKYSWTMEERSGIICQVAAKLRTGLAFCTPPSL